MALHWLNQIWAYRSTLVLVLSPFLLLPLPLAVQGTESSCGYAILLMAIYWITEVIPLAVTAFLPLILFPMMGIMTGKEVSVAYFNDTLWLFIGGLIIAVAIEDSGLHRRIALRVLLLFGTKPRCLMLGFMATTFFLSMWISNTATTAMMLPIVEAVFKELRKDEEKKLQREQRSDREAEVKGVMRNEKHRGTSFYDNIAIDLNDMEEDKSENARKAHLPGQDITVLDKENANPKVDIEVYTQDVDVGQEAEEELNERMDRLVKGITVCIPYSASIGGTATLTGTAPNLVLAGQFQVLFPNATQDLSFGSWIAYSFPGALVILLLAYIWLMWLYLGFDFREMASCVRCAEKSEGERNAERTLREEFRKTGPMRWAEGVVLIVFVSTALLWFFRKPGFITGWSVIFRENYITDGTLAMTMGVLLFALPRERPEFLCSSKVKPDGMKRPVQPILDWPTMNRMFPWSVAFLLAGGFALAKGAVVSGFSQWMGQQLSFLNGIAPWAICLIVTIVVCLFTECSSNTATASLFIPILAHLAQIIEVHPLYMMIAPVLASSMAFMLPVATPPNAIAFSYGHLKVVDLIKSGWMLNIISIVVISVFINTYGVAFFGLDTFPTWAAIPTTDTATNTTTFAPTTALP